MGFRMKKPSIIKGTDKHRKAVKDLKTSTDNIGEGFMHPPYRDPKTKGPVADRKDLAYHGYKNFKSTIDNSPNKHYVDDNKEHNDGHPDDLQTPQEHKAYKETGDKKQTGQVTDYEYEKEQDKKLKKKSPAKKKGWTPPPIPKKKNEKLWDADKLNVEKAKKMANLNPLTSLVKGVKTTIDTIKKKKKATKVDISREKAAQVDNTIVGKKKKV